MTKTEKQEQKLMWTRLSSKSLDQIRAEMETPEYKQRELDKEAAKRQKSIYTATQTIMREDPSFTPEEARQKAIVWYDTKCKSNLR
jgi:hypothetical protein